MAIVAEAQVSSRYIFWQLQKHMVGTRNLLPYFNFQLLGLTHIDTRWLYLLTPSREGREKGEWGTPRWHAEDTIVSQRLQFCRRPFMVLFAFAQQRRSLCNQWSIKCDGDQGPGSRDQGRGTQTQTQAQVQVRPAARTKVVPFLCCGT